MDPIKEAFVRAKQDIQDLKSQMEFISLEIQQIKQLLSEKGQANPQNPSNYLQDSSIQQINPTNPHNSTHKLSLEALKTQFTDISTGNRGVPTDRQTNQQTDQHIQNPSFSTDTNNFNKFSQLSDLLDSLDSIKSELKSSFKSLTRQELLIFSTIYQLNLEGFIVDYSLLAKKLSLSESSIRDYTQKLIKKGIPLSKIKENNKKIYLKIPQDLQKIASLQAILSIKDHI